MCGICGKVNLDGQTPVDKALLQRMCDSIRHRGPDGEGQYLKGAVGLGNRRLSIIDLATGNQPISNEDGTVWIVFNGEIYNYQELHAELLQRGHKFATRSDTETIVHAYEEWGVESCARLRGMFAYALWDVKKQRLVLVRDRMGKKPVIYTRTPDSFLFASELRVLLQDAQVQRTLNQDALYAYLLRMYVPAPHTIFEGVYKLPPAHYLILENGEVSIHPYWQVDFSRKVNSRLTEEDLCQRLWDLLEDAVRVRLMSEVPLGAFLSGGVDSSAVVGIMSRLMRAPVKTFSIRFEEMDYDETPYARQVAQLFHTDHHEFTVKPNAVEALPRLVWHYGEPFADASAIPTYYVSQVTRQHVTVALSGDAGAENFGGYDYYRAAHILDSYRKLPAFVRQGLAPALFGAAQALPPLQNWAHRAATIARRSDVSPAEAYINRHTVFTPAFAASFCQADFLGRVHQNALVQHLEEALRGFPGAPSLDMWIYLDLLNYLPDDINVKVDIASMANSLEVRAPLLDHHVVEFAASLPPQMKLHGSAFAMTTKYILKKTMERILPKNILYRRKHGFGVPISEWLRGALRPVVHDTLLSPQALGRGYFQPQQVRRLVEEHESGRMDHGTRLWILLNLELWQRTYVDDLRDSPLVL